MVFKDIVEDVATRISKTNSPTNIDNSIKRWVNHAVLKVARADDWKVMRRSDTITTVDGQEAYNLPLDFDRFGFIFHSKFGYRFPLARLTEEEYTDRAPEGTLEGDVYKYRMWEQLGVTTQMSSGATLEVVSSETTDKTQDDITVTVEGLVSSQLDSETFVLNGTTAVSGSKTFTRIDKITKDKKTDGRITVSDGTTTFAVLPVGLKSNTLKSKRVSFWFIPESEYSISLRYYARPFNMVDDGDIHGMGDDFDEAIILWATYMGHKYAQDPNMASIMKRDYKDTLKELRGWDNDFTEPMPLKKWEPSIIKPQAARFEGGYWPFIG